MKWMVFQKNINYQNDLRSGRKSEQNSIKDIKKMIKFFLSEMVPGPVGIMEVLYDGSSTES